MDRRRTVAKAHGHVGEAREAHVGAERALHRVPDARHLRVPVAVASGGYAVSMAIAAITSASLTAERASRQRSIRIDTTRRGGRRVGAPRASSGPNAHALSSAGRSEEVSTSTPSGPWLESDATSAPRGRVALRHARAARSCPRRARLVHVDTPIVPRRHAVLRGRYPVHRASTGWGYREARKQPTAVRRNTSA